MIINHAITLNWIKNHSINQIILGDKPHEDIWFTKEWQQKWKQILRKQFADFSAVTTVHGVIYIGEDGRHWFER